MIYKTRRWGYKKLNNTDPQWGHREPTTLPQNGATENAQHCPTVGPQRTHNTTSEWGDRERTYQCPRVGLHVSHTTMSES